MKKILLVFASYPDARQTFFDQYMSPRNKEYAKIHNFEYVEIKENIKKFRNNFTWLKFKYVLDLIENGDLNEGDIITHLDADMCIAKTEISYVTNKSFGYSIDSGNTHCMGSYSIIVND